MTHFVTVEVFWVIIQEFATCMYHVLYDGLTYGTTMYVCMYVCMYVQVYVCM